MSTGQEYPQGTIVRCWLCGRRPTCPRGIVSELSPAIGALPVALHVALRECRGDHQRHLHGGLAKRKGIPQCFAGVHLDHRHCVPPTAVKSFRRQKNHAAAGSLEDYPEQTVDPTFDAEVHDWLKHGLSRLPIEQRLTLELAYHMGHSLEEIAIITECPVGTVKARMFHAREKLRQYLPTLSGAPSELPARLG